MRRGLDWSNLQFFLEVARTGTLSRAARRLGADHATVGRRIQALEDSLGRKLFERHPRGYALTRQGEKLLAVVEQMEQATSETGEIAANPGGLTGTVRISTLEGFGNFFLAPRIGGLLKAEPGLTVEWLMIQQIVALSRRDADVIVTLQQPPGGSFVAEKLTDYRLFLYGTRDYLDGMPMIRSSRDLAGHVFAGYIEDLIFIRGLDYLGEIGEGQVSARMQNSSLAGQMAAACSGACLCVLPAFVAATRPDLVRILPENISLTRSYWMMTRADEAESPRLRRIRQFLRDEVDRVEPSVFMG